MICEGHEGRNIHRFDLELLVLGEVLRVGKSNPWRVWRRLEARGLRMHFECIRNWFVELARRGYLEVVRVEARSKTTQRTIYRLSEVGRRHYDGIQAVYDSLESV